MPTQTQPDQVQDVIFKTRSAQRYSQGDLAAELGVTRQAVSEWESGQSAPALERVEAWLADKRPWVYQMAFNVMVARFGRAMLAAAALPPETGA